MKIKKILIVVSLFVIFEVVAIYVVNLKHKEELNDLLNTTTHTIEDNFKTISIAFDKIADLTFNGYLNKEPIKKLFKEGKRDELYDALLDDYYYLKKLRFHQVHFHSSDCKSFLRMHKRYKFDDDLSQSRYSVKYVNMFHKPILGGFETGMIIPGFRYVYPLFYKGEYIGSVENSFRWILLLDYLKTLMV